MTTIGLFLSAEEHGGRALVDQARAGEEAGFGDVLISDWTMGLGAKDARLAVEVVDAAGIDLPATSLARDMYTAAAAATDDDIALVAAHYRKDGGT